MGARDHDEVAAVQGGQVVQLHPVVELLVEGTPEPGRQVDGPQPARPGRAALGQVREPLDDVQVSPDQRSGAGPLPSKQFAEP